MPETPRILVVGPSWVGDMVMAQSLFMAVKSRHPGAYLGVIAPAWTVPLLARMPEVDQPLAADFHHGKLGIPERLAQAKALRRHGFEQAIILPGSIKSALVPWLARIPRRTGYLGEMRYGLINDVRPLDKLRLPLTVQRFVNLSSHDLKPLADYTEPRLTVDTNQVALSLRELNLEHPGRPILALCPGAEYGPAKRWPAHHFRTLAKRAIEAGYAIWLFGSNKDKDMTGVIAQGLEGHCADLAGRTQLGQAIDLMSLANTVVSNDSGLMHVAAALGRYLVALYGSSSPGFTPPLTKNARVLSLNLDCSPCFKRDCPLGHFRCLEDLTPDDVFRAVQNPSVSHQI